MTIIKTRTVGEGKREEVFLDALESLFTGAKVEGDSGFVNLMRIKRQYFQSIQPMLMEKIDQRAEPETSFREELFDKLYTFFDRYFSENGSIYFRHLPAFDKTYEQVYADGRDVALAWKTHMLYYVKSDVLVHSMPVELRERSNPEYRRQFYFDVSSMEHKRNNEKREFIFAFDRVDNVDGKQVLCLKVSYSERGKKTKADDIIKQARKCNLRLIEDELEKAFRVFRRQTEVDFFINKDARGFLCEQFDLWLYQYMFKGETIFDAERVRQLQTIQKTAYDIIDFIAQFEDELRGAWEKPKFVRGVHYVVTLDRLSDKMLKKIAKHKGAKKQVKEWRDLGLADDEFSMAKLTKERNDKYQFLPVDTKHFKNLELEILDALGNLDEALDGELVHSENWQALNSLQRRYRGKVKCIYIDPPYNTDSDGFTYKDTYRHSSWLSMVENRFTIAHKLQAENGSTYASINENELFNFKHLFDQVYGQNNYLTTFAVKVRHENRILKGDKAFHEVFEMALAYGKTNKHIPKKREVDNTSIEQYIWQIYADPNPTKKITLGGKKVEIFAPSNYKLIKSDPSSELLKRISVRGTLREGNSSGRFYVAHIEPLMEQYQNHLFRVSGIGNDVLDFRYFWLPEKLKIRKNGDYFQGIPQNRKDTKLEPYSNLLDFEKAFNQCSNEGGVPFRNGKKPVAFIEHILLLAGVVDESKSITLDYFAGSGTTAHAVINLNREDGGNRKYLLVEMGDYFHTVLLPRIKKVVYSKDWKDGKPVSCEGSSHCFKYYSLEQYEETLKNACYNEDGKYLNIDSAKSPFEQYVFCNDDKFAHAVKPLKEGKLEINLHNLYPDIDIAESLSNILGKPIRRRTADEVTFADGTVEKINPANMTEAEKQHFIALIKPYLWWGE